MGQKKLLEAIHQELVNIHYHLDRKEALYMLVNGIKEDGKTGAWVEGQEVIDKNLIHNKPGENLGEVKT